MKLPIEQPFAPMEALSAQKIPEGTQWQYEPKWDGFRVIVFRNGKDVALQSKSGQQLGRYFPELIEEILRAKARRFVLDGEIVVPIDNRLSFDDLLQRIHPAQSRVERLSRETPASIVLFDMLALGPVPFLDMSLKARRIALEDFVRRNFRNSESIKLSPATDDLDIARQWYERMAGPLDGVIAKRTDARYESGRRSGVVQKIKNLRTADCVVGGFRYAESLHRGKKIVGSLLLGLYDDYGQLHHVGFTSGFQGVDREELTKLLESIIEAPGFTGTAPGGPSRWSTKRSAEWKPLKPRLVVEVQYDHFTGGRFRHGTRLLRFRTDKAPGQCKKSQVVYEAKSPLTLL